MKQIKAKMLMKKLEPDDLEAVFGGIGGGSDQDPDSVSCSVCGCKFSLPKEKPTGKCPDCGATVIKKK